MALAIALSPWQSAQASPEAATKSFAPPLSSLPPSTVLASQSLQPTATKFASPAFVPAALTPASASSLADPLLLATDPLPEAPTQLPEAPAEPSPIPLPPPPSDVSAEPIPTFGQAGSQRWYVQGGGATNLSSDATRNYAMAGAGISHFFWDGHSINLELNGMAFDQPGDDALGLNLALLLRWDVIRQQNWSLYIDGGAGILGTTQPVPSDGSSFNFTPQVGGGATIRLDGGNRLMVGLRWHHISNANTFDSNPGQDTVLGYVGINFPR